MSDLIFKGSYGIVGPNVAFVFPLGKSCMGVLS